jgi:subtilisin family serine protease
VCGDDGSCELSAILAGIDEITARKIANQSQPMVANMSLGGDPSDAIDEALRHSANQGVVYAVAAGNGLLGACLIAVDSQGLSPARVGDDAINAADGSDGDTRRVNGVLTTTSSTSDDGDANCNYGHPVTVAAPGVGITSSYLDGGYNTISGTSMATPHVAGAAMLYLQEHPNATPTEVEAAIVDRLAPWESNYQPTATGRLDVSTLY